jgi:beta-glucosidase/6-phospho-beta-glucosidase/beta-galactosidase
MQFEATPPGETTATLFPTFFMAGFECSTFVWKDGARKDYIALTGHDSHLDADYQRCAELGLGVVREAIRWPLVDRGEGRYDWSSVEPLVAGLARYQLTPIWDLCHYGFPDGCDPFADSCLERFRAYCRAAAEYLVPRTVGPRFFTPINELTFFSVAASDLAWMYPFARGRYHELREALCRMAIAGVEAIREVDPEARMVHVDPLIHDVPPVDRPDLADEAWEKTYADAFVAWDILAGRQRPELGGAPEVLDIVGVNVYHYSQAQLNADGGREALAPHDPRRKPLSELLCYAAERYGRPLIIAETSGYQDNRAEWLRDTLEEAMRALNAGVDLHGICLYPCVDLPDWHTGKWAEIGIFDIADRETCARIPYEPYVRELHHWQRELDQPEHIEPDGFGHSWGRVQRDEVRRYAARWVERHPQG